MIAPAPSLLSLTPFGLYCRAGDFYIDPWRSVERAVLTHGHADHARSGSAQYFATDSSSGILQQRLGKQMALQTWAYGEKHSFGDVEVSLHPAGHILGSAQVRISDGNSVTVCTGDFKRAADPSCEPFEIVPCDTLITEATFALPIYRWPNAADVAYEIFRWWQLEAARGRTCILCCYSLGKAQRILAELQRFTEETVLLHGAMVPLVQCYRDEGVLMLPTVAVSQTELEPVESDATKATASEISNSANKSAYKTAKTRSKRRKDVAGKLVLAPPSAIGTPWMQNFGEVSIAFASGWMAVRGARRRQSLDRGFVLSDHADWDALVTTAFECGARRIIATHGSTDHFVRFLNERGLYAETLRTEFGGEFSEGSDHG